VVRLLVHDTWGPPLRLGLLWVTSGTGGRSWWRLATVVRVSDLLARLDELDECLGNHAAVKLLEVLEGTLIVSHNLLAVSNAERNHFSGAVREVFTVGSLLREMVLGNRGSIAFAASHPAGRCILFLCSSVSRFILLGARIRSHTARGCVVANAFAENLEEILADFWVEHSRVVFLNR
jgi:hypothetical protein